MELSLNGIVLKSVEYGKNSRALTLLTDNKGKISVISKGCVSLKSPIHAVSSLFAYSNMHIVQNGGNYYLQSGDINELFMNLSSDVFNLALAQYFADACTYVAQEENNETELLRLLLNCLFGLCKGQDREIAKAVFEIRLCGLMGVMADSFQCENCYETASGYVNIEDGSYLCEKCGQSTPNTVFLNEYALKALEHIISLPLNKLFSFRLSGDTKEQIMSFAEKYLKAQLDINLKSLDFYKSLVGDVK